MMSGSGYLLGTILADNFLFISTLDVPGKESTPDKPLVMG